MPLRNGRLLLFLLHFACNGEKSDSATGGGGDCPFDESYKSVEEFGSDVVPIYCGYKVRCHEFDSTTYDECVEGYIESGYVSEECQWDPEWSCEAAQCISDWRAQEEALQASDPECVTKPDPWRPESCGDLYRSMSCIWSDGI